MFRKWEGRTTDVVFTFICNATVCFSVALVTSTHNPYFTINLYKKIQYKVCRLVHVALTGFRATKWK